MSYDNLREKKNLEKKSISFVMCNVIIIHVLVKKPLQSLQFLKSFGLFLVFYSHSIQFLRDIKSHATYFHIKYPILFIKMSLESLLC